jgi:hypothetical protein
MLANEDARPAQPLLPGWSTLPPFSRSRSNPHIHRPSIEPVFFGVRLFSTALDDPYFNGANDSQAGTKNHLQPLEAPRHNPDENWSIRSIFDMGSNDFSAVSPHTAAQFLANLH